ncbi:MAG: hypothetical protein JXC31_06020, partial [Acholeplasmataceae bacterium]|nr:hypothetical protein [Acholeplasmataceae bacterium]
MTKRIVKRTLLAFFVVFFLFISTYSGLEKNVIAINYDQSNSWDGNTLDLNPQGSIVYDSEYRYFNEIIASSLLVDTDKTYVIESAYDLYMLSVLAKGVENTLYLSLDYVLGNDIDYYEIVQQNIEQRFHPIGFNEPFTGSFDGQGFEITNLYFDTIMTEEEYQNDYSGLRFFSMFSELSASATVKNIGLINPIIIQPIEWGIMTYVSPLVGENYGTIDNVYLIDTRDEASGMNAEGTFHLSGLVSINYGTFKNSFIASKHIKSNAVVDNETTSVILYSNLGTISNLYYDSTLYADVDASTLYATGLNTASFQDEQLFDEGWFFNADYQELASNQAEIIQYTLNNDYPILQGLAIDSNKLLIANACDFLYMNELLKISGMFRLSDYLITNDIDMSSVSSDAYVAANVGFNGSLTSSLRTVDTQLYSRLTEQGGDLEYHTILNLLIENPTSIGNFASYSLFSSLFGTIENLNFANMQITTQSLDEQTEKTKVLIGTIAGQSNSGYISNVHVDATIDILNSGAATTKLYVGGLVGEGNVNLNRVSTHGNINHAIQTYALSNNESSTGGIIGRATMVTMNQIHASMDIIGMSYDTANVSTLYLGGAIGTGSVDTANQILQTGTIISHQDGGFINEYYISGIVGLMTDQFGGIHQIDQKGDIDVRLTNPVKLYLSGAMNIDATNSSSDAVFTLYSITNHGSLSLSHPLGHVFSIIELALNEIHIAGTLITKNIEASINGLFNTSDLSFDISLIKNLSGVLLALDTQSIDLIQSYNTGNITLESYANLTQDTIHISGNVISENINLDELRNEGDITIGLNHDSLISSGMLYVNGLFSVVSQDYQALNGYNGGDISITNMLSVIINYKIYLSGIAYHNANTNYFNLHSIDHESINDLALINGSVDHMLNHGDLSIVGSFANDTVISGILSINESLLSSSINLGHISNHIEAATLSQKIESSGLVYLMTGAYAQIIDGANNGQIEALSLNEMGYAHASGIALRNDLNIDGSVIDTTSENQYAKIWFSINYGDIYAFNGLDETSYNISNETHSKASGIFNMGLLSVIDVINYGNIYAKYLAGGIVGSLDFTHFNTYAPNQVYLANTINYGKIRSISDYSETYQIDMQSVPLRQIYNAFGSTIAKIHTSTLTWEFLSFSSSDIFPIDYITFGYMLNFDVLSNMVGNSPEVTLEASIATNGIGNTVLMAIIEKFMTTNPNDDSKAPFNLFFIEVSPKGSFYGKHISSFAMSDEVNGIFNSDFLFRNLPVSYSGTNQYLKNYFSYVSFDKASESLITKLEQDQAETYLGLYILSSSSGISNGIYLPDQFDYTGLSPHYSGAEVNLDWLGSIEDSDSALFQITYQMRQIKRSYATTIYDLEIKQVDEFGNPIIDGLSLNKPIIDESRGLITYYLPSNASILSGTSVQNLSTYSYVEASEGLGRKVPNVYENGQWIYKWVGNYKKSGYEYIAIGPYNTTGTNDVIFNTSTSNDKSAQNSDYINNTTYSILDLTGENAVLNSIYVHLPHVKQVINNNYWWESTGIYVNSVITVAAGYGPYKLVNYQEPPIYSSVYQYAGANEELVT